MRKSIIYVILFFLILMLDIFQVNGNSMNPTLKNNDFIIARRFSTIGKNDVVKVKKNNQYYIKRVHAVPGDRILCDVTCKINNVESNKKSTQRIDYTLKEDEYIVLGDNFEDSIDSRSFGTITRKEIKSELVFKI